VTFLELRDGNTVKVDDEDANFLRWFNWKVAPNGYVYATVYMHRLVMKAPPGMEVDHGDFDKQNNQKGNLEIATKSKNAGRRRKQGVEHKSKKLATSTHKGVSRRPNGRWVATITTDRKRIHLGTFDHEIEAASAYCVAASRYFGI